MNIVPFVIHNLSNQQRVKNIATEFDKVGLSDFGIQQSIKDKSAKIGICKAHKSVIAKAKEQNWDAVIVMEDDIRFTDKDSYGIFYKFVETLAENDVQDIDILMAGLYQTNTFEDYKGVKGLKKVSDVSGFHCYAVFKHAYDKYLKAPDNCHIDKWVTGTRPDFGNLNTVCLYPFLAIQHDGFFSEHKNQVKHYQHLLKNYELYKLKLTY